MSHRINPSYSSDKKEFYGVVPADTQKNIYQSPQGHFPITRLSQTDIQTAIQEDPVNEGHLSGPFDCSLAAVLAPIKESVGMIVGSNQLGSCTLISSNIAITACHCVEGIDDVRKLQVVFGNRVGGRPQGYPIKCVLEFDQELDYAIVLLEDSPGLRHGYPKLDLEKTAYAEPALLHHPFNQLLKVSIHTFVQLSYESPYLSTFHDSDNGSSGGAYIDPSGTLVAIHLGAERDVNNFNLIRLALPIAQIMRKHPEGILANFANRKLDQSRQSDENIGRPVCYLSPRIRSFIDLEKFIHGNLLPDNSYLLRVATEELPGIIIEHYQKKHCPNWPGVWTGKKGSSFSLHLDDIILLAEKLVDTVDIFKQINPANKTPSQFKWSIDKKTLGNELFKKLNRQNNIGVYAAFEHQHWQIHFFPI